MWRIIKLKKVWIPLILVIAVVGLVVYQSKQSGKPKYTTEAVEQRDLKQTVSVTGTVRAAEEINLNFKTSGRLASSPVKVGQVVKVGQYLASLQAGDAQASVLSAQAELEKAQAALEKLKAGASSEDVSVTQAAVTAAKVALENSRQSLVNTKSAQDQAVANAWSQLLGLPATAVPDKDNSSTIAITISGTYTGTEEGVYTITLDNPYSKLYLVTGLEVGGAEGSADTTTPVGSRGLRLQFGTSGTFVAGDIWTIDIPNKSNSGYAAAYSTYTAALTTRTQTVEAAEAAVRAAEQTYFEAEAQLALKQAPARSFDLASAEAAVTSARASLLRAQSDLGDRSIIAPANGTITKINNQIGETTSLSTPVLVLLSEGNYEIEIQVPEADVAKLSTGQAVDITLDAFGTDQHFSGHVAFIDPASTVITDVVYYEVTVAFDNSDDRIKPGMTANVDVDTSSRTGVLVIPLRAVKYDSEFKPFVEVLEKNELISRQIQLGLKGDDGLVEVLGGLSAGELVVTSKTNGK